MVSVLFKINKYLSSKGRICPPPRRQITRSLFGNGCGSLGSPLHGYSLYQEQTETKPACFPNLIKNRVAGLEKTTLMPWYLCFLSCLHLKVWQREGCLFLCFLCLIFGRNRLIFYSPLAYYDIISTKSV